MASFALITEGITDQVVIENILCGFFGRLDIDTNILQPLRDETDQKQRDFGGWYKVLEYCASSKFKEVFQFDDYVIIQIDTDVSEEKHYEVPQYKGSPQERSPEEMAKAVKEKIIDMIGRDFYRQYQSQIIFAIAVESLEYWFLPLLENAAPKKSATLNCHERVNKALKSDGPLNKVGKEYDKISRPFRKNKDLKKYCDQNPSLKIFYEEIEGKGIELPEEEEW
jgi:hypothetical protein